MNLTYDISFRILERRCSGSKKADLLSNWWGGDYPEAQPQIVLEHSRKRPAEDIFFKNSETGRCRIL